MLAVRDRRVLNLGGGVHHHFVSKCVIRNWVYMKRQEC